MQISLHRTLGFIFFFLSYFARGADVFVAPYGSDTNNGSLESPLRTIQAASALLPENGTCYIRAGIYRETVTVLRNNQSFVNYNNEYVVVTGLNEVTGWTPYKNGIFQAAFSGNELPYTQLFANGAYQQMARYPNNTTGDMMSVTPQSGYEKITVFNATDTETTRKVTFTNMPEIPADYWKGGYFRGISGLMWDNPHGNIEASSGKDITVTPVLSDWTTNNANVAGGGYGFIFHLNALDIPGEWHLQDGKLYFMPPTGVDPSQMVIEAQKRQWAFRINGKNGTKLKGLHIKAASIEVKASNCVVDSCSVRYLFPFFSRKNYNAVHNELGGIYVNGDNNVFSRCYVANTWGNGFSVEAGNNNLIDNCIIEDIGWNAQFTSSVLSTAVNTSIEHCTLGSTGRFHVRFTQKTNIRYCDLYDCMKMGQDAGSVEATSGGAYATVLDIGGSEIAYNYIHDSNTILSDNGKKQFVVALYFEDAANYTVHHNIIWNFKTNVIADGAFVYLGPRRTTIYNVNYYNNTVWNCDKRICIWNRDAVGGINTTKFANNIFDSRMKDSQSSNPQLLPFIQYVKNIESSASTALFENFSAANFALKAGSPAIDAGVEIPGITDGFTGTAPDAGAFEYGKPVWKAGSTIVKPSFLHDVSTSVRAMGADNSLCVTLSPNPFYGFRLNLGMRLETPTIICIVDMQGREVERQHLSVGSSQIALKNRLPQGVCSVHISNALHHTSQKLIVK